MKTNDKNSASEGMVNLIDSFICEKDEIPTASFSIKYWVVSFVRNHAEKHYHNILKSLVYFNESHTEYELNP